MRQIEPVVPPVIIARDLNDVYTEVQRQAGISVDGGDYSQDAGGNSINIPPAQLQRFFRITGNTTLPGVQGGPAYAWEEVQKTRTGWQALPVPHTGSLGKGNPLYEINGNDIPNGKVVKVWPDERGPGWDVSQTKRRFTWLCQYEPSTGDSGGGSGGGGTNCLQVEAYFGCDQFGNEIKKRVWITNVNYKLLPCDYSSCIVYQDKFWQPKNCLLELPETWTVDEVDAYFETFGGPKYIVGQLFEPWESPNVAGAPELLPGRKFRIAGGAFGASGEPWANRPNVSSLLFNKSFFFDGYKGCGEWYSTPFELTVLQFETELQELDVGTGEWIPDVIPGLFSVKIIRSRVKCYSTTTFPPFFAAVGLVFRIRFSGIPDLDLEIPIEDLPPENGFSPPQPQIVSDYADPPLPPPSLNLSRWENFDPELSEIDFIAEINPDFNGKFTFRMGDVDCSDNPYPCLQE